MVVESVGQTAKQQANLANCGVYFFPLRLLERHAAETEAANSGHFALAVDGKELLEDIELHEVEVVSLHLALRAVDLGTLLFDVEEFALEVVDFFPIAFFVLLEFGDSCAQF